MRCHCAAASGRRQPQPRPRPLPTVGKSHLQSDVASTHNQGTSRGSLQRKKVIAGGAHTIHHQQWHTGDAQRVNPVGWIRRGVRDGHQRTGTTTTTRRHIRRGHHTEHPASRHTLRSLGPRPPGRLGSGAFRRQRQQCDSKTRPPPAQHSTAQHITAYQSTSQRGAVTGSATRATMEAAAGGGTYLAREVRAPHRVGVHHLSNGVDVPNAFGLGSDRQAPTTRQRQQGPRPDGARGGGAKERRDTSPTHPPCMRTLVLMHMPLPAPVEPPCTTSWSP
jgi:hypothetical protein